MSTPPSGRRTVDDLADNAAHVYAQADARGSAAGAYNLGVVREGQGDLNGAEEAYARADERGHPAGAARLGALLERRGDLRAAEAAYRRAADRGYHQSAESLARMLESGGDVEQAARVRRARGIGQNLPATGPNFVRWGIVGTLLILALMFLMVSKRVPFVGRYHVDAVFQSFNQLRPGSPVRIAGVDIGKVAKLEDGPGDTRIVRMEIQKAGQPIHADATAKIRPRFFLEGAFYVDLRPGTPTAPHLESGGTIPLTHTATPVQFHQVLSALNRPARDELQRMIKGFADALDKGGAEALGRAMKPLAPALRDTSVVLDATRGVDRHDLSDLVRGLSRVTSGLGRNDADLAGLVVGLNRTTRAFAVESANTRATVRELAAFMREAPDAFTAVDRSLPPLEEFASALRPGLRIAPPVLRRAADLLGQLRALARKDQLPLFTATLRPALVALPGLSARLQELFRVVTPVTDCVRDRVVPVLTASVDDGHLSTGKPVILDFMHGLTSLDGLTSPFDANGPWIRLLVGQGPETLGLGGLTGRADLPLIGARPVWLGPGVKSPYRPDAPCRDQAAPDLGARAGVATATRTVRSRRAAAPPRRLDEAGLRRLLRQVKREQARAAR
jgi:phospholipid/cholesterol/gamma-HCH transport system substrate-binding protein